MMKKAILFTLSLVVLAAAVVSCKKEQPENPPIFRVAQDVHFIQAGPDQTDLSKLTAPYDPYVNKYLDSEKEALALYNDILSKTRDAEYAAYYGSYVKLYIEKHVAKRVSDNVVEYDVDPSYKSPVAHIWDENGSRDL